MMYGTMRQEMEEQIQEAVRPAFYDYIQGEMGPARLARYREVECVAISAVRKLLDGFIDCEVKEGAFLSDEEQQHLLDLQAKSADLIGKYRESRAYLGPQY